MKKESDPQKSQRYGCDFRYINGFWRLMRLCFAEGRVSKDHGQINDNKEKKKEKKKNRVNNH